MTTLLAARLAFVAGCCWEHCRRDGTRDRIHEADRLYMQARQERARAVQAEQLLREANPHVIPIHRRRRSHA